MRLQTMQWLRWKPSLILLVIGVTHHVFFLTSPAYTQTKATTPAAPTDAEISFAIDAIKLIAKDGVGNEEAVAAMPTLSRARSSQIPMLLEAFNGSSPLQRNWMMGAINRVVESGETGWSKQAIEEFFTNYSNDDYGRLVAFELMTRNDELLKKKMIAEMWTDPSLPLRHMAIADLIQQAEQLDGDGNKPAAVALLRQGARQRVRCESASNYREAT